MSASLSITIITDGAINVIMKITENKIEITLLDILIYYLTSANIIFVVLYTVK